MTFVHLEFNLPIIALVDNTILLLLLENDQPYLTRSIVCSASAGDSPHPPPAHIDVYGVKFQHASADFVPLAHGGVDRQHGDAGMHFGHHQPVDGIDDRVVPAEWHVPNTADPQDCALLQAIGSVG